MKKYAIRHTVNIFKKPCHEDDLYLCEPLTFDTIEELYRYFKTNHYIPYRDVTLGYQKEREYTPLHEFEKRYSKSWARRKYNEHVDMLNSRYDRLLEEYLTCFEIIEVSFVESFDELKLK